MRKRVAVVVLGDLGHSPRMQNHCLSLADAGLDVDFVGYRGSPPHRNLLQNRRITLHFLPESPVVSGFRLFGGIFGLFVKLLWQSCTLLFCLTFTIKKPDLLLLQNPPGLPAMLVCWLFCRSIGKPCKWLIDWHNYTFSIFGLRYGSQNHWFVRLVRWYEFIMGRLADGGLCVTNAMKHDLADRGIVVKTHYDAANSTFKPLEPNERKIFLTEIGHVLEEFKWLLPAEDRKEKEQNDKYRPTAMLVSSTSWTPDENFDIFWTALRLYDDLCQKQDNLPRLLVVVTGKGPLKEIYVDKFKSYGLKHVALVTPWLTAEDYPKLLACADIGVSLHFSSSGLDLPMKIVDMQACALPVLSVDFACVDELVRESSNGFVFADARRLHQLLCLLLVDYTETATAPVTATSPAPGSSTNHVLPVVRRACLNERRCRPDWHDAWRRSVWPYVCTHF